MCICFSQTAYWKDNIQNNWTTNNIYSTQYKIFNYIGN